MASTSLSTSIPLHCSICPGNKKFSDVSHLLTHVSSKGHLSHYFKIRVKSATDDSASDQVATYDRWYEHYGIGKLMSERMELKEKKAGRGKRHSRRTVSHGEAGSAKTSRPTDVSPSEEESVVDPRLSQNHEANPGISPTRVVTTRSTVDIYHGLPVTPRRRWTLTELSDAVSVHRGEHIAQSEAASDDGSIGGARSATIDNDGDPFRDEYPDPSTASAAHTIGQSTTPKSFSEFLTIDASTAEAEANEEDETIDCGERLKGVLWPGMDIFDAATPEMRRKRNQKKDVSVIVKMEISSSAVEPTELVFNSDGALKRRQPITGNVESSPLRVDTPSPKTSKRSKRAPFRERDRNRRKKSTSRKPSNRRDGRLTATSNRPTSSQTVEPPSALNTSRDSRRLPKSQAVSERLISEDQEFSIALDIFRKRNSRGFQVYNEASAPLMQGMSPVYSSTPVSYPASFGYGYTYPTFGGMHSLPLLNPSYHAQQSLGRFESSVAKSEPGKDHGRKIEYIPPSQPYKGGKENVEPALNNKGRIDDHSRQNDQKNPLLALHGVHPHGLPNYPSRPSFGSDFFELSGIQNIPPNPLNINFQQPQLQQSALQNSTAGGLRVFISPHRVLKNSNRQTESPRPTLPEKHYEDDGMLFETGDT